MVKKKVKLSKIHNGYKLIRVGEQWVAEHRLKVEEKIGRLLTDQEAVHHIDFNKLNNSIENLMLFPNQKEHARFHLKINQFGMTNPIRHQIENRWKELK